MHRTPGTLAKVPLTRLLLVCICAVPAALGAGCGNNDATPTAPTTRSSPVTETFSSNLTVQGSAIRMITAIQSGTFTATLTSAAQPGVQVGLAIGLRNGNASQCLATREVMAAAGSSPQLSAQVDAGDYCVRIFDIGQLQSPMNFSVTLSYP